MDPLTAVGLAGSIVTFVDFSTKVLSTARRLYESTGGSIEENDELESLAKNLKELADNTRHRPTNISPKGHFGLSITSETVLSNLSQQCIQVADELLEALDSIKVKGDNRTRKSAVQAVKTMRKQDHIEALQRRLDRISKQLMDGMSMEQLEEINRRLREMAVENTRLEANRSMEIDQLRRDFKSAISDLKAGSEEEQLPGACLVLSDTARHGQAYFAEQVILHSLRFSSINSRHESISKEHSQTFSWIFNSTSSIMFVEWLVKEDGVYWVSGKPGSGKSTLMKFLAAQEETKCCLEKWAGGKKLIMANYFFWSASTHRSQKSQQGLLRTILYQILRQCPELIQVAYHDQWIAMASDGKVLKESCNELLTVPALLSALRKISTVTASDTKFCFFVDGLDEYDGRPADIIELIDILKSFPNVKTCVSSRPWNDFEDRFGNNSPWKLYMQDLTRDDICLYVKETLGKNPRFRQLETEDPQCPNFIQNIVREADGVFLWVSLVIRSLLDGLTNSDRIKDLQTRVNETPKELKDYFKTMLFSTENRYRTQTARILMAAVTATELPLMAYWVIDQEDPKYMFHCPVETLAEDVLNARLEKMRRRLKVLSKGVLEVGGGYESSMPTSAKSLLFGYRVGFLHRTVKDYLQTPDAQFMLESWSGDTFNVDWEICNALGALAKMATRELFGPKGPIWEYSVSFLLSHATRLDQDPLFRTDMASVLEHLQAALAPRFEENIYDIHSQLRHSADAAVKGKEGPKADMFIIDGCVCLGVMGFVADKFAKEPQLCQRVTTDFNPLLCSVLQIVEYIPGLPEDSGILMLELLLAHGASPNSGCNGVTEWRLIMEFLGKTTADARLKCFDAIKSLLRHGADFEQECASFFGEMEKACELLREWFDADQFGILEDIVKRRATKSSTSQRVLKKMRHLKLWANSEK